MFFFFWHYTVYRNLQWACSGFLFNLEKLKLQITWVDKPKLKFLYQYNIHWLTYLLLQLLSLLKWRLSQIQCSRRNKERRPSMCTGCLMMEVWSFLCTYVHLLRFLLILLLHYITNIALRFFISFGISKHHPSPGMGSSLLGIFKVCGELMDN